MTSSTFFIFLSSGLAISIIGLAFYHLYAIKMHHATCLKFKDRINQLDVKLQMLLLKEEQLKSDADRQQLIIDQYQDELRQLTSDYQKILTAYEVIKSQRTSEQASFKEKLSLLDESKQALRTEFENLAQQLLDVKAKSFQSKQEGFFSQTMQPLKEQLTEFRQRIDKVYDVDSRDRLSLLNELEQLRLLNQKMSDDAINLTNALKGNTKSQGNWGELVLERVLETSGLRAGHEFELQAARKNEQGKTLLPDVIVNLPENKHLIIDSKVSLIDYQRFCDAEQDSDRSQFLKQHIYSIQQHIKGLSDKKYDDLEGVNSLDFVLLFMPIEAAYLLAVDAQDDLFQYAYDKHVILVCPSTLLAMLRTIENMWRYERQNINAEEIAKQAGGLYDQCVLVAESIEDIGRAIGKSQEYYEIASKRLTRGRGNVIKRIDDIKQLGAKTKRQLSASLRADFDNEPTISINTPENSSASEQLAD